MPALIVSNELQLYNALISIFPGDTILQNVKKDMNIKYPTTGKLMEFDIWIPKYQLCFEFQDAYHYMDTWYSQRVQDHIRQKDGMKEGLALQQGTSLVIVPCWWDQTHDSLSATICFERPDLVSVMSASPIVDAIHLNPRYNYFIEPTIPDIDGLMLASFPFLNFELSFVENNWWMGEKYDGVRCCWNPYLSGAFTRFGKELQFLPNLLAHFPPLLLDSEIWYGRGHFAYTSTLVGSLVNFNWPFFRVLSFDLPSIASHNVPYELRYQKLLSTINIENPFILVAMRALCKNEEILEVVQTVIDNGGEGLILQKCGSVYDVGRSESLIKLKTAQGDQEGIVVRVDVQHSVLLKLANGTIITVPPEDVLIPTPAVGDVVTFSYDATSRREVPTNPKIFRVRTDIGWDEMVHSYFKERQTLGDSSYLRGITKPRGYWSPKNMRSHMEAYARSKNLDPLKPDTWYTSFTSFIKSPSGRSILSKFKHGYYHALKTLFPEVKFAPKIMQYFKIENRRSFFETYAKTMGFDPLNPSKWYSQPLDNILATKGSRGVLLYHKFSVPRALLDLFPNIGLERSKFGLWRSFWDKPVNRRNLFVNYAAKHHFDPLNPENWYKQPRSKLLSFSGIPMVILHHGSSISRALVDLFPNIDLDRAKFGVQKFWVKSSNRRRFFENYAKRNGFDPLIADNWYTQSRTNILSLKGALRVVSFHGYSVVKAIVDLFPSIIFEKSKFLMRKDWTRVETRRKFFESYASKHDFDPLVAESWREHASRIMSVKGITKVLSFHGNSMKAALEDLFPTIRLDHIVPTTPQKYWDKVENRREFFRRYASNNNFDPLLPVNWYQQSINKIVSTKGAYAMLIHHSASVPKALQDLFPNIGINLTKFGQSMFWQQAENRRAFFKNFATTKGFDPLNPEGWYSQSITEIINLKGVNAVLRHHDKSIPTALLDLFPNIGLDADRFATLTKYWEKSNNRRIFFEDYASSNGFDPYNPENWYMQQKHKILTKKGTLTILTHHDNSLARALVDLFPDIGLEMQKLQGLLR